MALSLENRYLYRAEPGARHPAIIIIFFVCWFSAVCFLALHHVVWRDEVRALSLALTGTNLFSMVQAVHGEGHPLVWYLLLRASHSVYPHPWVLQIVALAISSAAVLIFLFRSPFNNLTVGLVLFSYFSLYEYSVMGRNYGISMLLMFIFAALYERYRDRGIVLGSVLFLLANTNAHSALLACAFMLFWLSDILLYRTGVEKKANLRMFALNGGIVAIGIIACGLTIFPTFNDAAQMTLTHSALWKRLFQVVFLPGDQFQTLTVGMGTDGHNIRRIAFSILLLGSTLALLRRPSALIAALFALWGMSFFFEFIYVGFYRHTALFVTFLISLYWIVRLREEPQRFPGASKTLNTVVASGLCCFFLLLSMQVGLSAKTLKWYSRGIPESGSRGLATLISQHPELRDAVIIADPDYLLEPLPYYLSNPTYFLRGQRFGHVVAFTRHARINLSLDDILLNARQLSLQTHEPVIILLAKQLHPYDHAESKREGYNWKLDLTPTQVRTFLKATKKLASFELVSSDEAYDVYLLKEHSKSP